jgi:hypothetical protein
MLVVRRPPLPPGIDVVATVDGVLAGLGPMPRSLS